MHHAGIRRSCCGTVAPPDDLKALRYVSLKIEVAVPTPSFAAV